jgi:hypothetical protein
LGALPLGSLGEVHGFTSRPVSARYTKRESRSFLPDHRRCGCVLGGQVLSGICAIFVMNSSSMRIPGHVNNRSGVM